jgi:excisionase family DNA binding protein
MPSPIPQETRWISINEAAIYLGVHPQTIRNMIRRGDLRVANICGLLYRLDRSAIDSFIQRSMRILPPYRKNTHEHVHKSKPWLKSHAARRKNARQKAAVK